MGCVTTYDRMELLGGMDCEGDPDASNDYLASRWREHAQRKAQTMEATETIENKPMTLADLRRETRALLGENKSFCFDLEVWDHAASTGAVGVKWSVYVAETGARFTGPSPEYVLDELRRLAAASPREQTAAERIAEVSDQAEVPL